MRLMVRSRVDLPQPDGPMSAVTARLPADPGRRRGRRGSAVVARQVAQLDDRPRSVRRRRRRPRADRVEYWMDGHRRSATPSVGASRSGASGLAVGHGSLLYHWMCLERRARTTSASTFRMKIRTRITMIVAAAMPWKSACGRLAQSKTWIGRTVKPPSSGCGSERHERGRPDDDERRGLADRPGHGQDDAGHDPGRGRRQDRAPDHLPAPRAEGVGAFALRLRAPP